MKAFLHPHAIFSTDFQRGLSIEAFFLRFNHQGIDPIF